MSAGKTRKVENQLGKDPEDFQETTKKDRVVVDTENLEYDLRGVQVEPEAGFWSRCRTLCTVTRKEVFDHIGTVYPYPYPNSVTEKAELKEIRDLQAVADKPKYFKDNYVTNKKLSIFLSDPKYIMPHPAGAVLNRRGDPARKIPGTPILRNGLELATLFENETPGLWHRHVFNIFLDTPIKPGSDRRFRDFLSPPRQALYWHALDLAIDSAPQAVWHYKWLATKLPQVARRRRPFEADKQPILFDFKVQFDATGNIIRNVPKPSPPVSPGTPRHLAYGSGHSTYSAAASYVLGCLFDGFIPGFKNEFMKLADNIGEARIWGGVHWRTDHEFGQQIGLTVGKLVINQLNTSSILANAPAQDPTAPPITRKDLEEKAKEFQKNCGKGDEDFCDQKLDEKNLQGRQG